ncbi:hypothetical protein BGZ75_008158 [Mortierella antarctica]|nr:hypothetical protein BGZ75_008158 [Mortierella antarctica]
MFPSQLHFMASGHQDGGGRGLISTGFSLGQGETQSPLEHQYQQGSQQQQQHQQQPQKQLQQHAVQHSTGLGYHVTQAVGVRSPAGSTGSAMSSSSPATSNYSTANSATPPPMGLSPGISSGSSNGAGAGIGSGSVMTSTAGGMVMSSQMTMEGYDTGFGANLSGEGGTDPNGTQLGSTGGVYWEQLGQE